MPYYLEIFHLHPDLNVFLGKGTGLTFCTYCMPRHQSVWIQTFFCVSQQILQANTFCNQIHFASKYILQPNTFCKQIHFATKYILQPNTFCNQIHFATTYILQANTFWNQIHFASKYISLSVIFTALSVRQLFYFECKDVFFIYFYSCVSTHRKSILLE
jgi:hypothetical protein